MPKENSLLQEIGHLRKGSEGVEVHGQCRSACISAKKFQSEEDMEFSSFLSGTERAVKTRQASLGAFEDGIITAELLEKLFMAQGAVVPNFHVYDVTKFLEDHPGGDDVLLSATGKDATDDFEDVGHSSSARAMLDDFLVGDIDTSTFPVKQKYSPPKQPHYNQDKTSEFIIKLPQFLVPLAILGLAFGIHLYSKST
ncbi:hypothetical protein IFM89_014154 [Coptis chinensis]|uniref:Cytochrome b5 heme-binding domain-containing protein n=1 Tax=Coptis chinensis TaxID=261450 RepID=A0A835HVN0_9MAGN|nr:hypothetical protein IFM89_014154 [Coptis chinensis]